MNKINFQDLPSTSTPLNATNLNQLQTNIENDLYYKSGDTIQLTNCLLNGDITGDQKNVRLTLYVRKSLANITGFTFSTLSGTLRGVNGYMDSSSNENTSFLTSEYTPTVLKKGDNMIEIDIYKKNEKFSNSTNNTTVTAYLNITLSLS